MSIVVRGVVALAVAAATTAAGYAAGGRAAVPAALGPGPVTVVLDIDRSRFQPSHLRVAAGTTVRFVVRNADPINHELIVGPPEVHARHRFGEEAFHHPVPGEVSVPAMAREVTSFTFEEPGTVEFACHLPGHYDYGMRGDIEVVPTT